MRTLGDHLRRRRVERGLLQREVARELGVSEASVWQWENNRSEPKVMHVPAIYAFLGYAPWSPPDGFGAWLRQVRRGLGLSRKKLAQRLGVDESTVFRWETGGPPPDAILDRVKAAMAGVWTAPLSPNDSRPKVEDRSRQFQSTEPEFT